MDVNDKGHCAQHEYRWLGALRGGREKARHETIETFATGLLQTLQPPTVVELRHAPPRTRRILETGICQQRFELRRERLGRIGVMRGIGR